MSTVIVELSAIGAGAAGLSICAIVAGAIGRISPFYRKELDREDLTRLTPLDGLRGILCFCVMFHHAEIVREVFHGQAYGSPTSRVFRLMGETSVALFFSATAFLFWSRALASTKEIHNWPFLRGRFFRIAPAFTFGCLIILALAAPKLQWRSISTLNAVAHMCLMGLRSWRMAGNVDLLWYNLGVQWSLQYEWAFYLALPSLALFARDAPGRRLLFIFVACFVMFGDGFYLFFAPGMLAAHIARMPDVADLLRRRWGTLLILFSLTALPVATCDGFSFPALMPTTVIFVPIACGNDMMGILRQPGLRLMGLVSYSVYLFHGIAIYVSRPLLENVTSKAQSALVYWVCVWGLALFVLIVCTFTYRWIEWPCIRLEKSLRQHADVNRGQVVPRETGQA